MSRPLVVIDTETATSQGAPHLLELGAVRIEEGEIESEFCSLVRPEVPIEPGTTEIHGITDEDVRDAPPAGEVLESFGAFVGDDWMAAHNAPIDARVLGFECARTGSTPPPGPMLDSLRIARKLVPESPDHKLATLCCHLDLEGTPPHRALGDAIYCWKLIEECLVRSRGSIESLLAESGSGVSIADHLPRRPRLPRRLRRIEAAMESPAPLTFLYGNRLAEPAQLSVLPRFLFERHGKGYLEAESGRSGELRTYRLDRVHKILEPRAPR